MPRAWQGVFQDWVRVLAILGQKIAPPQFLEPIVDEGRMVSRAWGRGFFQDVYTALIAAGALKLAPPQFLTMLAFQDGSLTWAWIGWMQAIHDAFTALGQVTSPPPIRESILEENK